MGKMTFAEIIEKRGLDKPHYVKNIEGSSKDSPERGNADSLLDYWAKKFR